MAKFTFHGRKKQAPKVTVTAPPMSKAQKILGATALNIDAPHQWEDFSGSKVSVAATDASDAPTYASSARHQRGGGREWGDESEIVPRQFRNNGAPTDDYDDDGVSDMTSILRKRQSSSTLHSWYDKSKQPLSISQQTSNSAMAKGLPPKAQRMLDMDHALENAKSRRKKPAKLDLSHLIGRSRNKKNENQPWEGPILGGDQVVRSPSVLSPLSTPSLRGKLSKRPTKESLRSLHSETNRPETNRPTINRPATGDSSRRGHGHLNGLPNLYEHYEQMSFRQVMDEELHEMDEPPEKPKQMEPQPKPTTTHTKQGHHPAPPAHHDEQIVSQYAKRHLPQTPQAILASKPGQSSPTDCAASVSSRHTRTSKASKRTDRSFQESDLQEKSVLSLSSDSEEDEYMDSSSKGAASVPEYAHSDAGSSIDYRPATSRTSESADNSSRRLSRSSKGSKRTSFATTNNYLTIPNGHHRPPTVSPRASSLSGSSTNTIQEGTAGQSPSRVSSMQSNSSANTTMTWQSKPGYGLQQAKAVTMHPAHGPSEHTTDSEPEKEVETLATEPEAEVDILPARKYVPRDSTTTNPDAPTPPLSPSSVDFYIRSAHSSIDGHGNGGHNRFMAVTRQEEMLLAALRHKRQIMRETFLNEMDEGLRNEKLAPKGHQSKPSEATITESSFDFDFPAPPTCKDKTTVAADGTKVLDLSHSANQTKPTAKPVSVKETRAPPTAPLPPIKKASPKPQKDHHQHERILLYLDSPLAAEHSIDEAEPSPDLSDFYEYGNESEGSEIVSEVILYAKQRRHSDRKNSQPSTKRRPSRTQQSPNRQADTLEVGVPRPDSPISPDALSAVPRRPTVNKKTARLSAVGPARWGYED
ncbi:hypothetical protein Neosp_002627 [[Neocosmospora] mangrovei]